MSVPDEVKKKMQCNGEGQAIDEMTEDGIWTTSADVNYFNTDYFLTWSDLLKRAFGEQFKIDKHLYKPIDNWNIFSIKPSGRTQKEIYNPKRQKAMIDKLLEVFTNDGWYCEVIDNGIDHEIHHLNVVAAKEIGGV